MVMSPSKPRTTDILKELDEVVLDPSVIDTVRLQQLEAELAAQKAEVERLTAELNAKTVVRTTKRKQTVIQAVESLPLAKKYYVLLQLAQSLPYKPITEEDDIDLDALIPSSPNKQTIVYIAHLVDYLNLRKRVSNSCPNFFEDYLAELGITDSDTTSPDEEDCPL